jgi:hypothetical protein
MCLPLSLRLAINEHCIHTPVLCMCGGVQLDAELNDVLRTEWEMLFELLLTQLLALPPVAAPPSPAPSSDSKSSKLSAVSSKSPTNKSGAGGACAGPQWRRVLRLCVGLVMGQSQFEVSRDDGAGRAAAAKEEDLDDSEAINKEMASRYVDGSDKGREQF